MALTENITVEVEMMVTMTMVMMNPKITRKPSTEAVPINLAQRTRQATKIERNLE